MSFKDYKSWFTAIFGFEATNVILDEKNECIVNKEKKLWDFFKTYERIEPIPDKKNGYVIKGCNECVSKGIIVRKQDTPGFLGKLSEIKYVIIGLEVNIPKKYLQKGYKCDIHVAFNQFKTVKKEHQLFSKLRSFFSQIKEKAYVTDIAKCRSTNLTQSEQNCLEITYWEKIFDRHKIYLQAILRYKKKHYFFFIHIDFCVFFLNLPRKRSPYVF